MSEQFLGGLVRIHVALLEGGVDVGIGVVLDDLLDRPDGAEDASRGYLSAAAAAAAFDLGSSDHLKRSADVGNQERTTRRGGEGRGGRGTERAGLDGGGRWRRGGGEETAKTLGERGGERSERSH